MIESAAYMEYLEHESEETTKVPRTAWLNVGAIAAIIVITILSV